MLWAFTRNSFHTYLSLQEYSTKPIKGDGAEAGGEGGGFWGVVLIDSLLVILQEPIEILRNYGISWGLFLNNNICH